MPASLPTGSLKFTRVNEHALQPMAESNFLNRHVSPWKKTRSIVFLCVQTYCQSLPHANMSNHALNHSRTHMSNHAFPLAARALKHAPHCTARQPSLPHAPTLVEQRRWESKKLGRLIAVGTQVQKFCQIQTFDFDILSIQILTSEGFCIGFCHQDMCKCGPLHPGKHIAAMNFQAPALLILLHSHERTQSAQLTENFGVIWMLAFKSGGDKKYHVAMAQNTSECCHPAFKVHKPGAHHSRQQSRWPSPAEWHRFHQDQVHLPDLLGADPFFRQVGALFRFALPDPFQEQVRLRWQRRHFGCCYWRGAFRPHQATFRIHVIHRLPCCSSSKN